MQLYEQCDLYLQGGNKLQWCHQWQRSESPQVTSSLAYLLGTNARCSKEESARRQRVFQQSRFTSRRTVLLTTEQWQEHPEERREGVFISNTAHPCYCFLSPLAGVGPHSPSWTRLANSKRAGGRGRWLKPVIPALWGAVAGGSRGQEIETILVNMAKPRLY